MGKTKGLIDEGEFRYIIVDCITVLLRSVGIPEERAFLFHGQVN